MINSSDIRFEQKVQQAITLIKSVERAHGIVNIAYSGGKDSDVILALAKLAGVNYRAYYNCTTIDPPGVIHHCEENDVKIIRPEVPLLSMIEKKGWPNMWRRWCCQIYKEKFIADSLLVGIRRDESVRRAKRYSEVSLCRLYKKGQYTEQYFPILNWNIDDESKFVQENSVKLHHSYIENGSYNLANRLGCIGCPLQGDRGKADFKTYPGFFRLWVKHFKVWCDNHGIADCYSRVLKILFYSNHGRYKYECMCNGLFEKPNAKKILEDYFKVHL